MSDTPYQNPPDGYPPLPEKLPIPVYDNHTHLEMGNQDLSINHLSQLAWAESVGVRGVMQVGTDLASSHLGAALAAKDSRVLAAVALHPNEAPKLFESGKLAEHLAEIDALAQNPRVRAIGETGLDFFRTDSAAGQSAQYTSFAAHIEIAKQNGLALQIHDRNAHQQVLETLDRVGAPEKVVFHCFSGDADFARVVSKRGWYLSFAGTVTFKNAPNLREALAVIPRSHILVETDAPFLTPAPFRGKPNAPYMIPYTLRAMAEELKTDIAILAQQVAENTENVYGTWDNEIAQAKP